MRVMNTITDKPAWDRKVFDEQIVSKWRKEISQSGLDMSPNMMDWIIKELQWKSGIYQETGIVQVFDIGVVKSDTAISQQVQQALKSAVHSLQDIPKDSKDYHPGSDQKVVDLVHPSLFPVVYGRTRVLPDRVIDLDTCLDSIGKGEAIPVPSEEDLKISLPREYSGSPVALSQRFQWLPCDVELTENNGARVLSYINNLHPITHRKLYQVIEEVITQTIPLWNMSLTANDYYTQRIEFTEVEYDGPSEPPARQSKEGADDEDEFNDEYWLWMSARPIKQPEPGEFNERHMLKNRDPINLQEDFKNRKLQVIVKLANIELTPDKPEYEGGTWHVEGQLNERICASAIYYYDSANITESTLAFRHRALDDFISLKYEQDLHQFLQVIYGFSPEVDGRNTSNITQLDGSVVCKEGRLITFPNIMQHRVSPFSLADRTKPGHRKILALFLVDPHRRVISSANVPPQREDWRENKACLEMKGFSMSMVEAKKHRLLLMEERGLRKEEENRNFEEGSFCLCEH
ncbi:hypothetical protein N7466_001733 [Penicillium verhagenii]|uniref:uncharacterized protein n=1 Tax=Penicillium verhagenii TaxID=1562060 RepID=UPI0025453CBA|nr:uncharacterized protein N7466_001733 [Penicillium verhagenii]KAJ5938599.1 hypothetical protein N7466_001733 [Penicillium verhagenii]